MDEGLLQMADDTISTWPDVKRKQVFGHRAFVKSGKMFAFIAEGGLAVKAEDEAFRSELCARPGVGPFVYNGSMTMEKWPVLPVGDAEGLADALTAAQVAFDAL